MKDTNIKGTGNSRKLKSAIAPTTTWQEALAMLIAGTFPVDFNGIDMAGIQQLGDALGKATLLKDAVAEALGLPVTAVPSDAFSELGKRSQNSLLRDMKMMLNMALGTNNIDAWADLLSDTSRINTALSSGYTFTGTSIKKTVASETIQASPVYSTIDFGYLHGAQQLAQSFTPTISGNATGLSLNLLRGVDASDGIRVHIYSSSGGNPLSLLCSSNETIAAASIPTGTASSFSFTFTNAALVAGTQYFLVIRRTGSLNDSAPYYISVAQSTAYAGGCLYTTGNGSSWSAQTSYDASFSLTVQGSTTATVIWNPVTATEAFRQVAVTADQVPGSGVITWYISDDGRNWIQITSLDTMQTVNFDASSVYLQCILTVGAEVKAVAWGGY